METRIGWRRALLSAEHFHTTVLCSPSASAFELSQWAHELGIDSTRIQFLPIQHDSFGQLLTSSAATYLYGYRRWHRQALAVAQALHAEKPFTLVHQVNFCGYREPGDCWRLGLPFVWGPVGGTQYFPAKFLGVPGPLAAGRELMRNALNWFQLRYSPRVRAAANTAAVVLAATSTGCRHLQAGLGVKAIQQLETGLDCQVGPPRLPRDPNAPLKILWAGRLRSWKGFPLLVEALRQLPKSVQVQVRVLGHGPCRRRWQSLAKSAGVDHSIEWIDWPTYPETLSQYRWADVFAFTSLRDTSGTGLLESLASGTPIIGLDHQGAADIMTSDCAIPIPVINPTKTAAAISTAIAELAADQVHLARLSEGARNRASSFAWEQRSEFTRELYTAAITGKSSKFTTEMSKQDTWLNVPELPSEPDQQKTEVEHDSGREALQENNELAETELLGSSGRHIC